MTLHLLGLTVVPHPLALDVRVRFEVIAWPGRARKRRKAWRVQRIETRRPGCYQAGSVLYMHPELVAQLPAAVRAAGQRSAR